MIEEKNYNRIEESKKGSQLSLAGIISAQHGNQPDQKHVRNISLCYDR